MVTAKNIGERPLLKSKIERFGIVEIFIEIFQEVNFADIEGDQLLDDFTASVEKLLIGMA